MVAANVGRAAIVSAIRGRFGASTRAVDCDIAAVRAECVMDLRAVARQQACGVPAGLTLDHLVAVVRGFLDGKATRADLRAAADASAERRAKERGVLELSDAQLRAMFGFDAQPRRR